MSFNGKDDCKMTFECGKGGDGKGREFVFEKALFGDNFGSLDCGVFLDRAEWRRSVYRDMHNVWLGVPPCWEFNASGISSAPGVSLLGSFTVLGDRSPGS